MELSPYTKSPAPGKFGECLDELLSARGWSAARLARAINVDSSYVRRWIRGDRTPSLSSAHTRQISGALCDGLDYERNPAICSALSDVIEKRLARQGSADSLGVLTEELLIAAQVYSLQLDSEQRRSSKGFDRPDRSRHFDDLFAKADPALPNGGLREPFPAGFDPAIPSVITGKQAVGSAVIALLAGALRDGETDAPGELFFSFHGENDYFDGDTALYEAWQHQVAAALNRGWTIRHLCRLTKNAERSLTLVKQIIRWMNYTGVYDLYYFNKYGVQNPPYEIVAIKGRGALLCFAARNRSEIDSAIYVEDKEAAQVIYQYSQQLFLHVEPLVNVLTASEYFVLNALKDKKPGKHLIYTHDLSFLTMPDQTLEAYLRRSIHDPHEYEAHWSRVQDCLRSFQRDIGTYKMMHMFPMKAVQHLVRTGSYYFSNSFFCPNRDDIRRHLEHVIWLLRTFDTFEIALIGDNQMDLLKEVQWDVKGDHTVTMGLLPKSREVERIQLISITEGTLVSAFQEYFLDLWERVNPIHREKTFVIDFFENMLSSLD